MIYNKDIPTELKYVAGLFFIMATFQFLSFLDQLVFPSGTLSINIGWLIFLLTGILLLKKISFARHIALGISYVLLAGILIGFVIMFIDAMELFNFPTVEKDTVSVTFSQATISVPFGPEITLLSDSLKSRVVSLIYFPLMAALAFALFWATRIMHRESIKSYFEKEA